MSTAISIDDLTFVYRGQEIPALRNIQGGLDGGSMVVVLGHGGAGKSTLCASMNGIVPHFFRGQYRGRVTVKGLEVARHKVPEISRIVGLVLEDFEPQLFSTNVELEMAFGPENLCLPRQEIESRIRHYLPFLGLENFRRREPASLSGGQKQRLAISSVLTMEPEVLVMDEPTTDLDPEGREEVQTIARRLREQGRTLLVVDCEPETGENADQVWLMREGQLVARGVPREILTDIPRLKSCGIKVPKLVELFSEMRWPGRPLTAREAIALIEERGLAKTRKFKLPDPSIARTGGASILKVEDLGYLYPAHRIEALREINLNIQEGEFVALIGQNGSGKTTLAKHFNALLKPTSGRVLLRGKPTTEYTHREISRLVGYVFQNPDHQIFCNTVYEEVAFGLKMLGEPPSSIEKQVSSALETVGLTGYEKKVPFALGKGERQRVAVASVLAIQPEVLVLDEPTTGLDDRHQRSLMEMLKNLHREGHTIIIITHSMETAAEYAGRAIVMKGGSILLDGPTRDVFAREDRLKEASLYPSSLVQVSNWLGTRGLTVRQLAEELRA
jgi:energy-coupling factor transport system ATP-binding protein